jgi:peptidoglycan/xylan/chitin deacetylase (PgdA/CDA1 family)
MNLVRQALKRLLSAVLPAERWLARGRRARGLTAPAISLTFDDGPHPEYTPQVLDRLQMFGWKATFFVIGEKALRHPDLIRRIVREGHELGTHSWSHGEPVKTSAETLLDETRKCERLLYEICRLDAPRMRPPKGELTWSKLRGLWRERRTIVLWNVDPKDYRKNAGLELRCWAACYTPAHGDIVLLHDSYPQALEILDQLQEHHRLFGFETVAISSWLPEHPQNLSADASACRETEGLPC